jgi:hypothetical protein
LPITASAHQQRLIKEREDFAGRELKRMRASAFNQGAIGRLSRGDRVLPAQIAARGRGLGRNEPRAKDRPEELMFTIEPSFEAAYGLNARQGKGLQSALLLIILNCLKVSAARNGRSGVE